MRPFCVYIMASRSRVLYVGVTNDIVRRVDEHKRGLTPGFTTTYHVTRLVHLEQSSRTFVTRLPGKRRSKVGVVHGRCACSKSTTLPGKTWQIAGSRATPPTMISILSFSSQDDRDLSS